MANAHLSTLATQLNTNAAAVATAAAGTIVTSDIVALADFLKILSMRQDFAWPPMQLATPSLVSTYIQLG